MENSPLRFLKDNDVIIMINEEVPKSKERLSREFHSYLYKNKLNNNLNYFFKVHIDNTFWKMTQKRDLIDNVSFIQPSYPFYCCPDTNKLDVNHAVNICEDYSEGEVLPCGIVSNGAQCMCDICFGVLDDY